jgi:leucyl-tRNA synthetase
MKYYHPNEVEPKWQKKWAEKNLYQALDFSKRPKKYILVEFPYLSGEGLHVGHCRSYSALDALVRKKRMESFNVLFPMGWDAFGLPTENYALKTGIHPLEATKKNVANIKRQFQRMGFSFDWSREINTTDPGYYKWTQWIFLKLFAKGLAYQAEIPINWCPSCKIGLANEEVVGGKCERCEAQTERVERKQWMFKITAYADRLLEDLDRVDFESSKNRPERKRGVDYLPKIKAQQINWIGRSEGITLKFSILNSQFSIRNIEVFTTRADTIFGVTAIVVAPEHQLVAELMSAKCKVKSAKLKEIKKYVEQAKKKSELERTELAKEKTGVFTGLYCVNPVNNEKVPIWVGDYVVAAYGGGAIMVVPAHDYRDYDFAKKYGLEIKEVVSGGDITHEAFVDYGKLVNSGQFNGLSSEQAIKKITEWLEKEKFGKKTIAYKLRDWVFSRQHYWGEPIPIIHCQKCGVVPVPEKDLPVELPYVKKYQPTGTGESPLAAIKDWVNVKCPKCGGGGKRETDTMPNWAGSNWYFLRYLDPQNNKEFAGRKKIDYWMPVDLYNGGMEHTTLHLLYSRFIYKVLFDLGFVPSSEPYARRRSHGMVLAEDGRKMSKSFGNVINPDDIFDKFGADTLRLYEMFMGPFDQTISWSSEGVEGCYRFLNRVWHLVNQNIKGKKTPKNLLVKLHQTIKKVGDDLEGMKFNTAVAAMMEFINEWSLDFLNRKEVELFVKILAPFAPHLAEELWVEVLGRKFSVHQQPWPKFDKNLAKQEMATMIIQVNGKLRGEIQVKSGELGVQSKIEALAKKEANVAKYLEDKKIKKVIFVPGKIINFVI